ncbi:transketolase [Glaciimonas sp. PAMC28666]|uniref:transketolase n=1 Tax=Glaciimonas sp. PAMC28666 TaxID=2807626 RepID=UPI001F036663|nr:transketolase [Glaciimonas sp. PAMC28666]
MGKSENMVMHSDSTLANAIRALSMDAVQQANSGHPGMPMGMADIAVALWHRHLKHNPRDPHWPDRDRFVLSNGHGSMLLYSLLHLTGYALPIEEIKRFRQLHSKTPGHPEYGYTPGVEVTTGPLGQGLANAVGMALAERILATEFNRDGFAVVDHHTYVFMGDGCLMEGISHEACSLAGTWGLSRLIGFYDDNGISIDGDVTGWFTDDTPGRFEAYGWNVIRDVDGHDVDKVDAAIRAAKLQSARPTLICCKTVIGQGSPAKAGTHHSHGAPLGIAEVAATRAAIGWNYPPFEIPQRVRDEWDACTVGAQHQERWNVLMAAYRTAHPALAAEFERRQRGELASECVSRIAQDIRAIQSQAENIATRQASQNAIQTFAPLMPELVGGSADLAGSNLTLWKGALGFTPATGGNYLHYGVREFGMAAIMNGIVLHGALRPFGGTFLMFSEYARNALRMAALMKLNTIYVFTHDSIGLGEDGPTHQPVEQIATLRMIPNMDVWRPCDSVETMVAWQAALEHRHTPTALILSRQNLPCQSRTEPQIAEIRKGAYVLRREAGTLQAVLIATGSEVELAIQAQTLLAQSKIFVRVVSMPSPFAFDRQDLIYQNMLLPLSVPTIAIEAGISDYWRKYVGRQGAVIGIDTFGESAPASDLYRHFGLTTARIVETTLKLLTQSQQS